MNDEEAAWVRAEVWTSAMRKTHRECPGFYARCGCQSGLTHWCQIGQHDRCHRATPQRTEATVIVSRSGSPAHFRAYYEHPSDISATGPHREQTALVWLADRVCRWLCPCTCHAEPGPPEQLDLLAVLV